MLKIKEFENVKILTRCKEFKLNMEHCIAQLNERVKNRAVFDFHISNSERENFCIIFQPIYVAPNFKLENLKEECEEQGKDYDDIVNSKPVYEMGGGLQCNTSYIGAMILLKSIYFALAKHDILTIYSYLKLKSEKRETIYLPAYWNEDLIFDLGFQEFEARFGVDWEKDLLDTLYSKYKPKKLYVKPTKFEDYCSFDPIHIKCTLCFKNILTDKEGDLKRLNNILD